MCWLNKRKLLYRIKKKIKQKLSNSTLNMTAKLIWNPPRKRPLLISLLTSLISLSLTPYPPRGSVLTHISTYSCKNNNKNKKSCPFLWLTLGLSIKCQQNEGWFKLVCTIIRNLLVGHNLLQPWLQTCSSSNDACFQICFIQYSAPRFQQDSP